MKTYSAAVVILATTWTLACGGSPDVRDRESSGARVKPSEAADSPPGTRPPANAVGAQRASSPASAASARDVCALLSAREVAEVAGVTIERVAKTPNGCEWYPSAATQRQKGVDTVRGTFAKLTKEEPKSETEGVRSMENMLKGMTSAASPDKALFAVSIEWENADQAEAMVKTTIGVIGGGLPGGRLEPIDGLGDRAYAGPADVVFYVRKGNAFLTFGSLCTREQTIALARKIVSRI